MKEIKFETEQQAASFVIECMMRGRKFQATGRKSVVVFNKKESREN